MPIEFVCDHCQGLLKVGRRKIGAEVTCPKCGENVWVPDEVAAGVAVALRQAAKAEQRHEPAREFYVYDDPPLPSERSALAGAASLSLPATSPPAHETPRSVLPPRPAPARSSAHGRPRETMLLVSRNTLYMQAGLFVILGGFAFVAGWLIGRGREPLPSLEETQAQASQIVEGTISYKNGAGMVQRDHGSVVIAIPQGKYPVKKWDTAGLHPRQTAPATDARVLLEMDELGAVYARADANGTYQLGVKLSGRYTLLFISRNARRATGEDIQPDDLDELSQLFASPVTDLIGRSKYGMDSVDLAGGQMITNHSHDFGLDGK